MVGVGREGTKSALARVSVVNYYGNVLYDAFVVPTQRVKDWRTKVSGITPARLTNGVSLFRRELITAKNFHVVRDTVMDLLKGRILIGHALKADLTALELSHPREAIRDTCLYEPFRASYGTGRAPSLKKIVQAVLGITIQKGQHDSVDPGIDLTEC